jgi:hypothetical protein
MMLEDLPMFPKSGDHKDVKILQDMVQNIDDRNGVKRKALDKFDGHPVPGVYDVGINLGYCIQHKTMTCGLIQ